MQRSPHKPALWTLIHFSRSEIAAAQNRTAVLDENTRNGIKNAWSSMNPFTHTMHKSRILIVISLQIGLRLIWSWSILVTYAYMISVWDKHIWKLLPWPNYWRHYQYYHDLPPFFKNWWLFHVGVDQPMWTCTAPRAPCAQHVACYHGRRDGPKMLHGHRAGVVSLIAHDLAHFSLNPIKGI